ncbi:hypothetical protein SLV14_004178 [Streptomyces sp. Je 1-4]|uniref:hypothetical protein n=1 Tax=Streptomyces TaxID=1883 RepID=UPI00140EB583|nr:MULTISPECIES: hypothetical protein [unclassified Streptomyces]QIK07829.1 hypothetical protein G7Z12_19040 [Streptomyces sp. ID38640]UYB41438.1 hypothetical protein SLV14_004178 [Streptomyces sp. Je 1-4]UZQ37673.1 hypothetical protein SLV14N_004178 [Streptomyces sp. Je 1-4] [Streptomyces sp. Je 1-4 4N24]UZQ45090.1 hypothetical protein SLV14NA_004178 [Streptomyces sp. Je 1-4] [Streptomyces sp. Je 1-4 4N24_ara]
MRRIAQASTVVGACGLVLLGSGVAQAQVIPSDSLLAAVVGADVGTVAGMVSGVVCNNRLADFNYNSPVFRSPHPCINGPVRSGNSLNSGNFINHGNPNNSGNIANTNGSTNSANAVTGASQGSGNSVQRIVKGILH